MNRVKQEPDHLRGTGRTTRLIRAAPYKAVFVCLSSPVGREDAYRCGRLDLRVVDVHQLSDQDWRGTDRLIVVDHAVRLTEPELSMIRAQNTRHAEGLMEAMMLI